MNNLDPLADERGIPGVNAPRARARWLRGLAYGVVVLAIPIAGGILYLRSSHPPPPTAATQKALSLIPSVPAKTFTLTVAPPPPVPPAPPVVAPALPAASAGSTLSSAPPVAAPVRPPPAPPAPQPKPGPKPKPVLDKSGGALMVPSARQPEARLSAATADNHDSGLATLLTATATPPRSASVLPDRDYLLAKDTFIECVLETKLDSTVPGMTSCRVTRPIYSDTGRVVLIDRGSTVSGEYNATMRQGQARIFVLWNRIKTPSGVVVNLDSPATDELGAGGIPGAVDTHFWERFGGAILLSLVNDAMTTATLLAARGSDGQVVNFSGTSDAASSAVAEALRNTINIPPTLYTNQGAQVGIYVARDLSFKAVYELQASEQAYDYQ